MAFYRGRIIGLEDILNMTLEGQGPDQFSFLGIIETQTHEVHDVHTYRVHHEIILHCGSRCRLHLQYMTGFDDENRYDPRVLEDDACPYFPKGTLCFLPRLEVSFVDEEKIYCNFKGGDQLFGKITTKNKGGKTGKKVEEIGPNRVCLLLDVTPSSIAEFLENKTVKD